jgi:hypothetical protein
MEYVKAAFEVIAGDTLAVPVWEVLLLLAVSAICQLLRAARTGIFIIYLFTLHLSWDFLKLHVGLYGLIIFAGLAALILILGLVSVLTEGD